MHVESVTTKAPADAIIVNDAQLLFTGDFKRSGSDLVISKGDHELRLADYFKGEKHAPLASPDGAYLTGKIVDALTGHVEVAQAAGDAAAAKIIGHVTKLSGNATVLRNGVSIILNNGDNVHQGDVVQTGSSSTLGITFIDGSVFGLASNAKMVLNEMVYDPNGSNNSSLMSLVSGTISFVAGATAKHGDMKVDTPVATMGIRGTACLVEIEFDLAVQQPTLPGAPPVKFQVLVEPDGTTGSYVLLDRVTLAPLATINQAGTVTTVSGTGAVSFLASAQLSPEAMKLISEVFSQKYTDNSNPKSDTHFTDSPIPDATFGFKFANGDLGVGVIHVTGASGSTSGPSSTPTGPTGHVPGKPDVSATSGQVTELTLQTGSSFIDQTSGIIKYHDVNAGDIPTARTSFAGSAYKDAHGNDVTSTLTDAQKAAIANVSVPLTIVQDPAQLNDGKAAWTYKIPDGAADFLAEGEQLTLTYTAYVDTNFLPANETGQVTFTVTLTGTNDTPTIVVEQTTPTGGVIEDSNVVPPGGGGSAAVSIGQSTDLATGGTITFKDVDLTDTHTASFVLKSTDATANLPGFAEGTGASAAHLGTFALTPISETPADANDNGALGWTFTLDDNDPVLQSLAKGQTITQVYTVTVSDGHTSGGTVTQDVTVTITGTNDAPTLVSSTNNTPNLTEDSVPQTASLTTDGTITFQDLDLIDTHTATFTLKSSTSSAHLPGFADNSTLGTFALTSTTVDPTSHAVIESVDQTNTATVGWTFTLPDNDPTLQSLAYGETITQVYTVTITDNNGAPVTKDITVTLTGTNDAPTVVSSTNDTPNLVEDSVASTASLTADGAITFQDLDLIDTHTATFTLKSSTSTAHLPGFSDGAALGTFALTAGTVNPTTHAVIESTDQTNTATVGWTFTLPDNDPILQSLAYGQTITQVYTVTITDNNGLPVTHDVTITLTGTNDGPNSAPVVISSTNDTPNLHEDSVAPDEALATGGTITFQDIDLIDTHTATFTLKSSTSTAHLPGFADNSALGTFALTSATVDPTTDKVTEDTTDQINTATVDWTFTLADDNPVLQSLAQDQTITQVYTVTIKDNNGALVTKDITITLTGTNDAPTLVSSTGDTPVLTEDSVASTASLTADGEITFQDLDLIDTHTATFVLKSSTSTAHLPGFTDNTTLGTFALTTATVDPTSHLVTEDTTDQTNTATVGWTFTLPDNDPILQSLAQDQTITQVYTVTVYDGHTGGYVTKDITITLTGTNDAPTLVSSTNDTPDLTEDSVAPTASLTADGAITFQDLDLIDTHTATFVLKSSTSTAHLPGFTDNTTLGTFALTAATVDPTTHLVSESADQTNTATVGWTFTLADNDPVLQSLAKDQTITQVYTVTVYDGHTDGYVTKDITVILTGTNDAPVVTTTDGTVDEWANAQQPNPSGSNHDDTTSGSISFTDVDTIDTHAVAINGVAASGVTSGLGGVTNATIKSWLSLPSADFSDATGNVTGSQAWEFHAADHYFDYLADGEKLVLAYTIEVDDHNGGVVTKPVTITITGSNDTPVIAAGNQTATIAELGNNTHGSDDPDEAHGSISFTDVDLTDHHTLSVTGVVTSGTTSGLTDLPAGTVEHWLSLPTGAGNFSDSTGGVTGSQAWTFSAADHYFDYLAEGEHLTLTYTVQVDDGKGGTATRDVTITVDGANDAPVTTSDPLAATLCELKNTSDSDFAQAANGAVTFTDLDLSDVHSTVKSVAASGTVSGLPTGASTVKDWLSLDAFSDATGGTTGSQAWSFSAEDSNFDYLAAGEHVTLTYTIEVDDQHGGTVTQDVTITVNGRNDKSVITSATGDSIDELANNPPPNPTNDSTPDKAHGTISFTDLDLSDRPVVSATYTSYSYTDADQHVHTLTSGQLASVADFLDVTQAGGNANNGSADWCYSVPDSAFDFLGAGETLVLTYTASVYDGHATTSTTFDITVHGSNDEPHAANVALTSAPSGDGWVFDPDNGHYYRYVADSVDFAGATSAASGDGAYLATITSAAENAFIANLPGVSSTYYPYGVWTGGVTSDADPDFNLHTSHWSWSGGPETGASFTYTNWHSGEPNGGFGSTDAAMQITADGTWNDVPSTPGWSFSYVEEWGGRPADPVTEDQTRDFSTATLLANATDPDQNDTLTVTSVSATSADGAAVTLSDNTVTYDPTHAATLQALAAGETATDTFSYTVSDGHGGTSTATATVNVVGLNDAPMFVAAGDQSLVNHLTGISVPVGSQDGQSHPYDDNVWSVSGAAGQLNDHSGIGYLINPLLGNDPNTPQYSLHGHTYITTYEPDPTKYVITFQFDTPTVVTELDVLEHVNGVTVLHGYAGNSLGSLTDVGASLGSLGDLTGYGAMYNGELNQFEFANNTVAGTYFQVVVEKTSAPDGFALFRMIPEGTGTTDSASFTEGVNTTDTASGALLFTDVDASDTHSFAVTGVTASGSTSGLPNDAALLNLNWLSVGAKTDSTNGATGSQAWSFSADDSNFDYLAAGEQVTLTYAVQVSDGHGGVATHNVTVTVNGTNDAPVFTGDTLASTSANGADVAIVTNVAASDVDSDNYSGGTLTATVTDGGHQGDTLVIASNGYLALQGDQIVYDASGTGNSYVAIGTLTDNINSLTIDLNGNATDAAVEQLTGAIHFQNSLGFPEAGTRTVTFTLHDGGGTANGGHDSAYFTVGVTVPESNHGPIVDSASWITRVSIDSNDFEGGGDSFAGAVSNAGVAVFSSSADNLVDDDGNGDTVDIFIHRLDDGTTDRVNLPSGGGEANGQTFGGPSISANGDFVAFESDATNLVNGDTNGVGDVFLRDLTTSATVRISVDENGAQLDRESMLSSHAISDDGRYVVFETRAQGTEEDQNTQSDVYVRDLQNGTTRLVSAYDNSIAPGNGASHYGVISGDGNYVAFNSAVDGLDPNASDDNGHRDVFIRDIHNNTTTLVSAADDSHFDNSAAYGISGDGRYVLYTSEVDGAGDPTVDLFVRDMQGGAPTLVAEVETSFFTSADISADGRYVVYSNVTSDGSTAVFVYDMNTHLTQQVSVNGAGDPAGAGSNSEFPAISANGRFITFDSDASNLVSDDGNGAADTFVVDLAAQARTIHDNTSGEPLATFGLLSFSDEDVNDTHTATDVTPWSQASYVGNFIVESTPSESGGHGTFAWHYQVDHSAIANLTDGQSVTQSYLVKISDGTGFTYEQVDVTLVGTNDAPSSGGPVIDTEHFTTDSAGNNTPTTISDLAVIDSNAGESLTITATTAQAASGSTVTPASGSGDVSTVNAAIASVVYNPGATPPLTDKITFTVSGPSGSDTVNFVFQQAGNAPDPVLTGGNGKDVIFGTEGNDSLTGGADHDQFVFGPTPSGPAQHTITDFETPLDKIDLREFNTIHSVGDLTGVTQQGNDTLITIDSNDKILLQNVLATNISASNFLFHV